MYAEFFLNIVHKGNLFLKYAKDKKGGNSIDLAANFLCCEHFAPSEDCTFCGAYLLVHIFRFRKSTTRANQTPFFLNWFRKVTADKSRFLNICWVEKRTEYVTVRHWKSDWSQENKLCWMGDDIFGVVINLNVQNQWMVRVSNLVELDFNVL